MATKTYYGKLDCYSNVSTTEHLGGDYYKSFVDFLSYLSASNQVSLVSWNSGSSVAAGTFANRTYPESTLPFGGGAHSLWKFHTSSTRNWEWYMYAQACSGAAGSIRQAFNTPMSGYAAGGDAINGNNTYRGVIIQTAVCFSGTTSFNPWNGSISEGAGNASTTAGNGGQRWVSGSNDRIMYVLPRSNDVGGTTQFQKSNSVTLASVMSTNDTTLRYSFIYDGDALLAINDDSLNTSQYSLSYFGPFELRNSLTASGICGSPYGMTMYTQFAAITSGDAVTLGTVFGDTAGSTTAQNGGIAIPIGTMMTGSKVAIPNVVATFSAVAYQPNTVTGQYDEFPLVIGASESPHFGLLGQFNYGLFRTIRKAQTQSVLSDFSRAVFGGTTTTTDMKISVPWTGSFAPGVSLSRTGSNYTWTRNYG
ncbi:MAG: hypothetical protein WC761_00435 [Candidatus Paceibacterota bacterium]|jgi:hypothetical protein